MNEYPRGIYSPSPPSGHQSRTTLTLVNSNTNPDPTPSLKTLRNKSQSFDVGKHHEIPKTPSSSKRKSESLLRFEAETTRNSRKKRRYSDASQLKSSRIRLNSLETDRSISPHNKRRRISDISDLFQTDLHSDYKIQGIASVYDQEKLNRRKLLHLITKRPKIGLIVNAEDIIVALTKGGLAAAFNRRDLKLLCYLNEHQKEEINSLFYNKCDNSFIVISRLSELNILKIRFIPLRHIEIGKFRGFEILKNEMIKFPGWLEYDDIKHRMLTYNHITKFYKLWDLNTYSMIYSFCNALIEDVKISNDGLIECSAINYKTMKRNIKIRSLNQDKTITEFEIIVSKANKDKETLSEPHDFMEYHHGYLYVKYDGNDPLKVYDCRDRDKSPKILHEFDIPDAYLFLKRCNRLLYFKETNKSLYYNHYGILDLVNGEHIELSQHINNASHRESVMFVTKNQTKIIYYSRFRNTQRNDQKEGIIQINSLETGQLFGYIMCNDQMMEERTPLNHRWCLSPNTNKERENILINRNPLRTVTTIGFDDIQNEIYVGTRSGKIYIWA